jgi:hypothetical protein
MAPSCLKATGMGIKIPSIFLSLAMGAPFGIQSTLWFARTHSASHFIMPVRYRIDIEKVLPIGIHQEANNG